MKQWFNEAMPLITVRNSNRQWLTYEKMLRLKCSPGKTCTVLHFEFNMNLKLFIAWLRWWMNRFQSIQVCFVKTSGVFKEDPLTETVKSWQTPASTLPTMQLNCCYLWTEMRIRTSKLHSNRLVIFGHEGPKRHHHSRHVLENCRV